MIPPDERNSPLDRGEALATQSDSGLPTAPGPASNSAEGDAQTRHIGLVNTASRGLMDKLPKQLGSYRILGPLGKGGMGEVLDAWDDLLDRPAAIKIIATRYADDPTLYRRLQIEAKSAARLSHPNIVTVYQLGEDGMVAYIAMEKLEGESLSSILKARGRIPANEAAQMLRGVIDALSYAAEKSVIHRDIKPANLMVLSDGTIKVLDFGLAKRLDSDDPGLTGTNCHVGTPLYMSPEQASGEPCDHRTDIYALGITLYHMVVGHPPFQAASPVAIAMKHASTPLPISAEIETQEGEAFTALLNRMTAKNPKDRYATYSELLADVDAFLAGRPLVAAPARKTDRITSRKWAAGLGTATLLVVVGLAWGLTRNDAPEPAAQVLTAEKLPSATNASPAELGETRTPEAGGPAGRPLLGGRGGPREGAPGGSDPGIMRQVATTMLRAKDGRDGIASLCLEGNLSGAMQLLETVRNSEENRGPIERRAIDDITHSLSVATKFADAHFDDSQSFEDKVATAVLLAKVAEGPERFEAILYLLACSPKDGAEALSQYELDSPRDALRPEKKGPARLLKMMHEEFVTIDED